MTDTEAALLRVIGEQPDEDTPRLAYADCLDELGGASNSARAEFIRLQIRLSRLAPEQRERESVQARVTQLLLTWDAAWQTEMPPGFTRLAFYRRGFPYRAALTASLADGADDPRLSSIEYLELTADVPPPELAAVFRWPLFARVAHLVFRGTRLGGTSLLGTNGAIALAASRFPRLERLNLSGHAIGPLGLQALSYSSGLPRLRELDVSGNELPDVAVARFRDTRLFKQLRRFNGYDNLPP